MNKIDELISKFKEFKEELNKNVNMSYSPAPNMAKDGMDVMEMSETKHDKCAREVGAKGNVDNPHAVCVAAGVKPEKWKKSAKEKLSLAKNGQWSLDKCGTNEETNPSGNHNKEKFKVMPMAEEKSSRKEEVKGKPYMDKAEKIHTHPALEPCGECGAQPCKCDSQRDENKGRSAVGPV